MAHPVTRRTRDAGQVVPLLALVVALAALGLLALSRLVVAADAAARARTAADAAALAGAAEGRAAAERLAVANGAALVAWTDDGARVEVTVVVDGHRARAAATATVGCVDAGGTAMPCPPTTAPP